MSTVLRLDPHSITLPHAAIQPAIAALHLLADRTLTSSQFAAIAETLCWAFLEGEYRTAESYPAQQLRETLADITAQWECLLGEWHDMPPHASNQLPEFYEGWKEVKK